MSLEVRQDYLAEVQQGDAIKTIEASNCVSFDDAFEKVKSLSPDCLIKKITNKTAAIMVETVVGEGGIKVIPDFCLIGLRKLCNKKKIQTEMHKGY